MSKSILIRGGRVIDPSQEIDDVLDVAIADGKIAALGRKVAHTADEVIDAREMIVAPGLIDMHVHLREPGFEEKETIESGTGAAAAGGFTAVACMPNTDPTLDNDSEIESCCARPPASATPVSIPSGPSPRDARGKSWPRSG